MSRKIFKYSVSLILILAMAAAGFTPAFAAPPVNDNFANAVSIATLPFNGTVDITEATNETNEPQPCVWINQTIWFSFTPTETMAVHADTQGSAIYYSNINVYHATGLGFSDLQLIGCTSSGAPSGGSINFHVEAGQTYYLQAGSVWGESGNIQVNLKQIIPPQNDDFANATSISSLPFSETVDITNATFETGELQYCSGMANTAWFSFTPSATIWVRADMKGSFINSNLTVYSASGPGISGLQALGCAQPGGSTNFIAEYGQTYYFQVSGAFGETGIMQVNLEQITPPPNDNFVNAEIISLLPFGVVVDITNATNESGEPQYCYGMANTAWYAFTPTQTMVVRVDTQGSTFSNNLNIYHASGPGISDLQFMGCANYGGSISFLVDAGQTYYLQAGGTYGEVGSVQINLEQIPAPPNDNFADATLITSLSSPIEFDTTAATFESNEPIPTCAFGSPYRTIWYSFTALQDSYLSASVSSVYFNSFFAVYTETDLNNLTQLGCSQYNNKLTFHAVPGQTYTIQVGGLYGGGGIGTFLLEPPPPPVASFGYSPWDPSRFDTIQFYDGSYDPAGLGIQTFEWNFGDGTTASGSSALHKYAVDGDYQVSHTVTTVDGRTASATQTVQVRTHDVSITKVTAPKAAASGQTSAIVVSVRGSYYPETVIVDLYKSVPGGSVWINNLMLPVPVSSGNRTTNFSFNYTFTAQDAQIGKVTFRAVANLMSARDAFPQDNTGISSPTRVSR